VEKRGPVRDKTLANIMLGARLGSFQINLQFCWPSPKGVLSTWYIFATMARRNTVCSRYNRQLIELEYVSEWPLLAGNVDRLMSFCCRRFSYNENTL